MGAVIGFLILRKRGKTQDRVTPRAYWRATEEPTAADTAPPVVESQPTAAAQPVEAAPTAPVPPVVDLEPEPKLVVEPVPEPKPIVEAPVSEPVAEPAAEAETVIETPELEVEPIVAEEPEPEAEPEPEPEAEPELEMEIVEEVLVEVEPEVEPEAEAAIVAAVEPEPEAASEVEVEEAAEIVLEEEPRAEEGVIGEALSIEPELLDIEGFPEVELTPDVLEEPIPGAGWAPSVTPLAEEDVEEVFPLLMGETPAVEEVVPPSAPESPVPAPSISADDLKARIEETRRRIRRELEEPFVSEGAEPAEEPVAAARPEAETVEVEAFAEPEIIEMEPEIVTPEPEPVAEEPVAEEPVESVATEEEGASVQDADIEEPASEEAAARKTEAEAAAGLELGVDFDAMKNRIEETRGRLKAKAFDAMMSGESALLGRDSSDRTAERPAAPELDQELESTIESGLREDEEI